MTGARHRHQEAFKLPITDEANAYQAINGATGIRPDYHRARKPISMSRYGGHDFFLLSLIPISMESSANIPMQYTGLKDGKEIYEGDVVRFGHEHPNITKDIGTVEFSDGCFWLNNDNHIDTDSLQDWDGKMEVIGNIYDGLDLLN